MDSKPEGLEIIKILNTRNIGFNRTRGLFVERHIGLDRNNVKWDYLAHIDPVSGKVIETWDYRRIK